MHVLSTVSLGNDRWRSAIKRANGSTYEVEHTGLEPPPQDWVGFRRALLGSAEYILSISLAISNPSILVADYKLTAALDMCLLSDAEPEEIAAFQSALALYLSQLPDSPDGVAISSAIQSLCAEYLIPTTG